MYCISGCGVPVATLPSPSLEALRELLSLLKVQCSHLQDGNTVATVCVCVCVCWPGEC